MWNLTTTWTVMAKRDLVKAFIQVPRSAVEGSYKAATLYEARPYCAGVQADGYDHMKEVESKEYRKFDFADLDKEVPARIPEGTISAMDLALKADPADWYYPDKGNNNSMVYENLDNFNYYLVRGFAVVVSAGFGALGSDGLTMSVPNMNGMRLSLLWNGYMVTEWLMKIVKERFRRRQTGPMEMLP